MTNHKNRLAPIRFIGEEISVQFGKPPVLTKKPGPPQSFTWRGERFGVIDILSRWFDFQRKGRAAKNMSVENLRQARRKGSWGVGRYYFRVVTESGRVFDLYYDRAPKGAGDRHGHWFLWRELEKE